MKKIRNILLVMIMVLALGGCGNNSKKENEIFSLKYDDMNILLGEEFSRLTYGEELEYAETPSCAFEDMDRTYTYEHYSISTYTEDKKEKVLSIYFLDDKVKTTEGVSIGDEFTKVKKAYGKKYQKEDNLYTYERGKTKIEFIVENDVVTSIEYVYEAEE